MPSAEERFRGKVARGADHDLWTGAQTASGTGVVRINGALTTVQRAAWEFAHGLLPAGARVLSCPQDRACVRIGHLRLAGDRKPPPARERHRAERGSGSKRELRPGVWRLTVTDGTTPDGRQHRRSLTIGGSEAHAAKVLADLAETTRGPMRLGDLRVRELLDRYVSWLETGRQRSSSTRRLRELADAVVEPAIGRHYAALLDVPDVYGFLRDRRQGAADRYELRDTLQLLAATYGWARDKGWTTRDPIGGLTVPDITG